MKALELLKTLRDDYIHGELDFDINEAIEEIERLLELVDSFDKKMPRGDKVFKIEIVDDLNQVVMENFK